MKQEKLVSKSYGSRTISTVDIKCIICGWKGLVRDLIHSYKPDGRNDVEPISYCPKCEKEL